VSADAFSKNNICSRGVFEEVAGLQSDGTTHDMFLTFRFYNSLGFGMNGGEKNMARDT